MALKKLIFKPGINRDQTNYANEGGWWAGNKIRFLSGFPQKIGGWIRYTVAPYIGLCRALFNWVPAAGSNLMAVGTDTKIYVEAGANLYDITPLRATYTSATTPSTNNCIGTTSGTKTITVTLPSAHGATTGDYVTVSGVTGGTIGGISVANINGEFVVTVTSSTAFTFQASGTTNATSTVSGQGGTAITLAFQISPNTAASVSGYGWGIPTWGGVVLPSGPDTGWGIGATNSTVSTAIRLIYFDNRVEDLMFNIRYGDLYYWDFTSSLNTRAISFKDIITASYSASVNASDVPIGVTFSMFEDTSGVVMAFGCSPYGGGAVDPLLVRWSSAYNPQNATVPYYLRWAPDISPAVSTAGYLSIQSGSQILYALSNYGEVLVFTESSLTALQAVYTTGTLDFAQSLKSADVTLIGPRCVIARNNIVYWMGIDRFYYYDGIARVIPCTLRQQVFDNINFTQTDQFFAAANDKYNEIWWFYCSASSNVIDSYVVFNYAEQIWYYGNCDDGMVRTAWLDSGYRVNPVAAGALVVNNAYSTTDSSRNYLYNHEYGNDDNNVATVSPIYSYIQSSDVDMDPDGDKFILLRRIIPDVSFYETSAGVNPTAVLSVVPRNFPGAAYMTQNEESQTFGRSVTAQSATLDQYTNQVFLRARARQMGFKIESTELGVAWQLGAPRVDVRQDGMRG